jgi:uncharacterized membrane protein required for colicin V production
MSFKTKLLIVILIIGLGLPFEILLNSNYFLKVKEKILPYFERGKEWAKEKIPSNIKNELKKEKEEIKKELLKILK